MAELTLRLTKIEKQFDHNPQVDAQLKLERQRAVSAEQRQFPAIAGAVVIALAATATTVETAVAAQERQFALVAGAVVVAGKLAAQQAIDASGLIFGFLAH